MERSGAALPAIVGRYAMYGQIGAGGMATVHLGRGPGGEIVAIKRLKPHLVAEPDVARAFLDEARLSARVRHPNVVATLDVVTHDEVAFLVLEYVEGVSLAILERAQAAPGGAPIAAELAVAVVSGALRGLHAAHDAVNESGEPLHIVHRDVSPQNILVGVDGTARVLDFGVAKALGRQQTTRDGKIKGKLGYMAPEQLSGRGVTRRTDVFAAGIVLWELLAGERLFQTDEEATTVTRVLMERVRPPSEVRSQAPTALDGVVLRALERDPSKRFLTAEDMAEALERALTPAGAAAVGWWVRSAAADELARRAVLLRADAEGSSAPASDSASAVETTTVTSPVVANPRPARASRRYWLAAAALAVTATALGTWGEVSASRAKGPRDGVAAAVDATPSAARSAAAPGATAAPPSLEPAVAPAASSVIAPSARPMHHPGPKGAPPRSAGSARERLYSRD